MAKWARVDSRSLVAETFPPPGAPAGMTPSNALHPDAAAQFIACPDNVVQGWIYSGGVFRPVQASDEPTRTKPDLLAYNGDKRWKVETNGVTVNGRRVKSDADSQRKVATTVASFRDGSLTGTIPFKLADGTFFNATAEDMVAINNGIIRHIDSCYRAEESAANSINTGATLTYSKVDTFYAGLGA